MAVTTSIVVQFSAGSSGDSLSAEVDSREDGLNQGKTSFAPGDTPVFLLFKSSDSVIIDAVIPSAGAISPVLVDPLLGLYDVEEWVTFADTTEASLQKTVYSGFTYLWYGNNLGTVTVSGNKLVCAVKGVGVLKVKYKAKYVPYSLASPSLLNGKSDFQIAVVVKGHS